MYRSHAWLKGENIIKIQELTCTKNQLVTEQTLRYLGMKSPGALAGSALMQACLSVCRLSVVTLSLLELCKILLLTMK